MIDVQHAQSFIVALSISEQQLFFMNHTARKCAELLHQWAITGKAAVCERVLWNMLSTFCEHLINPTQESNDLYFQEMLIALQAKQVCGRCLTYHSRNFRVILCSY